MSDAEALKALASLRLTGVMWSHGVWEGTAEYVPELHPKATHALRQDIDAARADRTGNDGPLGRVIEGEAGTGKTHLLGWVREQVQQEGGYFFLVALAHGETFWESVVESLLDGLWRPPAGGGTTQLQILLTRLGDLAGPSRALRTAIERGRLNRELVGRFVDDLGRCAALRPEVRDTARALMLYAGESEAQDAAKAYFLSDELDASLRAQFSLGRPPGPERLVRQLSQLLALTGHTVIAVDQVDPLIARAESAAAMSSADEASSRLDHVINQVADGMMGLQEGTTRTLTLLTCIPLSWQLIRTVTVATVADRFVDPPVTLKQIQNPEMAQSIVGRHLGARYRELGFIPPYASWPAHPLAFAGAVDKTPRSLLRRIAEHVQACLAADQVTELVSFEKDPSAGNLTASDGAEPPEFAELDIRFEQLRAGADISTALDHRGEDLMMPLLLRAGLMAWILERAAAGSVYEPDPPPSSNPPLHARLRRTVDEQVDAQVHRAFRAIAHPHPLGVQNRLRKALIESGIDGDDMRALFVLRSADWPRGPKTQELVADFVRRGGEKLAVDENDLRTFEALRELLNAQAPLLQPWLVARQSATGTALLRRALPPDDATSSHDTVPPSDSDPRGRSHRGPSGGGPDELAGPGGPDGPDGLDGPVIEIGTSGGSVARLNLEGLRKHVAVFAGSGSGKTVLLRRLIEECALQGVSSIVLDPNNDLARLGEAWPCRPGRGWKDDDDARAEEYLTSTDVVIWTPRRDGGRPLAFQPLPDFSGLLDDPDEFRQAVDVAVSALAPRARAIGRTSKVERQKAVLRRAVEHFAREGGTSLAEFVGVLRDVPAEASSLKGAAELAEDMAETLEAVMINDPMFGGHGAAVDPGILLTPAEGKRARISVISFVGLPDDEQRQSFVSQLQMALFAWFKRNPAGERPLGGLLVMDEAQTIAPSGAMTASTESTLVLASQARKYGLGLVFATQAPKGLHNRIPGNAATQLFGYLNSPSQIATAREIARSKGSDVPDISRLGTGEFYLAAEGMSFRKITAYNSLSHHPRSPLNTEEVVARARAGHR